MKKEIKVRFTKTRSGDPLVDIEDLGGFGLEYTPEQLMSLANVLHKIALDSKKTVLKGWQEYHY